MQMRDKMDSYKAWIAQSYAPEDVAVIEAIADDILNTASSYTLDTMTVIAITLAMSMLTVQLEESSNEESVADADTGGTVRLRLVDNPNDHEHGDGTGSTTLGETTN